MITNALKQALFITVMAYSIVNAQNTIRPKLRKYLANVSNEFSQIPDERKKILNELGDMIVDGKQKNEKVAITFICTSNSRRSHFSQVWMQIASIYYGIDKVNTFSGGTEATEPNIRAIDALKRAGITITRKGSEYNSPYFASIGEGYPQMIMYSKKYDDQQNPKSNFIAVMVCSEADNSCPTVPGANGRIGLPFDDPKYFDNTPSEKQKYDETCRLIARELLYVANYVKKQLTLSKETEKK